MSSRSSGFYKHGIHLFLEQTHIQVCIDFPESFPKEYENEKYGSFTMSDDDWKELAESILEKVSEAKIFRGEL